MRERPQMNTKPRNLKVSGFPSPRCARLSAARRPNSIRRVLSRCSDSENSSNRSRIVPETPGVGLVLEANNNVVGIPHDDDVARGLAPSPALGPEIEHVVQIDVGQERRDHRPLTRPLVADRDDQRVLLRLP